MKYEIEHKYLVDKALWDAVEKPAGVRIIQGYLTDQPGKTIRVRTRGNEGFLTIKGPSTEASRLEYEYPIPVTDAAELLENFASSLIEKIRYVIPFAGKTWEVDEFLEANEGLLIAEIELDGVDENYEKPAWVTLDVTGDPRYYNSSLARNPFKSWKK